VRAIALGVDIRGRAGGADGQEIEVEAFQGDLHVLWLGPGAIEAAGVLGGFEHKSPEKELGVGEDISTSLLRKLDVALGISDGFYELSVL